MTILFSGCAGPEQKMLYLGVENYGSAETIFENVDDFRYRFSLDGEENVFSIEKSEGFPVQNVLKEGYSFIVTLKGDTVTAAKEVKDPESVPPSFTPAVSGVPGEKILTNLLKTALMPAGTVLYIYGGGWDWQGCGPGIQARTLGVSPCWLKFFREKDENFTYKSRDNDDTKADPPNSYFTFGMYNEYYYAGLDCSGYLNWVLYNT